MTSIAKELECVAGELMLGVNGEGRLTKLAWADHDTDFLLDEPPSYLAQIVREGQSDPEAPLALD
jgi:hypothetical protein